ncbi:HlyD family secretion protein [Aureitalea marina]|uniref:Uncharacterized protein n=1 Tax=Aureitalea marina TaxID=930804 RepID=A0A2S7KLS2_9FLAO|nr:HlyD family efflux transporter periplasmic adaptor subunit [Aureitalea marina]PQB03567.1 hypothetical protein BST85_00635 [Aureitalea marina]
MPLNNQQERSTEVQDILNKPPNWMLIWGNGILLLLFVFFFLFTWFIQYPDIIETEAIVTSPNPPQKEYAQSSGKLKTLLVSDNQQVSKGTVLAMLDNTAQLEDVLFLKAILDTINIMNSPLEFPLEQLPGLSLGEISSAFVVFQNDYIEYRLSRTLDPLSNELSSNELAQSQLRLRLANLEAQKSIDARKMELSKNEYERNEYLYKKGVISLNEIERKKLEFLDQEKNMRNLDLSISQIRQNLSETSGNATQLQINGEINDVRLAKKVVQSLIQLKEALRTWDLKYVLRANRSGRVSLVNIWNEDQYISQGDLLFTIVPEESRAFIAHIKAPIHNSGKIAPGQRVNIKLHNYPEEEYGKLNATVSSMSAIPNEDGFYMIKASLPDRLLTSYEIEIPFRSELSGTAEIITEDLRLLERFFYQLRGIFNS